MGQHPIWTPSLQQHGPPVGANSEARSEVHANGKREFECDTLADLRNIEPHVKNWRAVLMGENEAFDGLLQGLFYWVQSTDEDNGGDTIRSNYAFTGYVWKKLNI